jgi:hypothetical protein
MTELLPLRLRTRPRRNSAPEALKRGKLPIHLVLDIDQTLVDTVSMSEYVMRQMDKQIIPPPDLVCLDLKCYVYFRPHLMEFLDWAFTTCQSVSVFTAAEDFYAHWILRNLGPRRWFGVLSKRCCLFDVENDTCVKPLHTFWDRQTCRCMGMNAGNTIHIDDRPENFSDNLANGLTISEFRMNNKTIYDRGLLDIQSRVINKYNELQDLYKSGKL